MIEIEALGWVISFDPSAVLAPGMFLALVVALLSGFPVAFCLGGVGVIFAVLGMFSGEIEPQFVAALPQRIVGIMANFTLLAIPAFVFMGAMLERSGIAERLLETMGQLLGRLRGGLALAVVIVGSMLAATTGVVAATQLCSSPCRPCCGRATTKATPQASSWPPAPSGRSFPPASFW